MRHMAATGRRKLTPKEIMARRNASGVFLPPEAKEELEEMPVADGEDAVAAWIVDKMRRTSGALSIMDDAAIREAADAICYYHRVKAQADNLPLTIGTKVHPVHSLLKSARTAKVNAMEQIGLNPKGRMGLRTANSTVHLRSAEVDYGESEGDELDGLLDATA